MELFAGFLAVLGGMAAGYFASVARGSQDKDAFQQPILSRVERALEEFRDEQDAWYRKVSTEMDGILEQVEGAAGRAKKERMRAQGAAGGGRPPNAAPEPELTEDELKASLEVRANQTLGRVGG